MEEKTRNDMQEQHKLLMAGCHLEFSNGYSLVGTNNGAISYYTLHHHTDPSITKHATLENLKLLFEMVANSDTN